MNKTTTALLTTALVLAFGFAAGNVQAAAPAPSPEPMTLDDWNAPVPNCNQFCQFCFLSALLACSLAQGGIRDYYCGPDETNTICLCAYTCGVTQFDRFVVIAK